MNRLAIATIATAAPMGAQVYEAQISRGATAALAAAGDPWHVDDVVARSIRSPLAGNRRLPIAALERSGTQARRVLGRFVYPRGALVHRMGLTLPPAPREVVTMHDTVAWRYPDEGTPPEAAGAELRAARAVVCVSQFTADDIAERFRVQTTRVVHLGVDERFRDAPPLAPDVLEGLGIRGRYILHAGGASLRKNLPALAAAWAKMHDALPDVSLVLSGPPHPRRTELFAGLPRTVLVGRVDQELVPGLIAAASAVVVPSLDEGFGLPVLEAMAAGTPVVAAATSSLPEVAGGAALLAEPNADAIAEALVALLEGGVDGDDLIARGRARAAEFTWERCLAEHAEVWKGAAD